ncbi:cell division protein FtsN [Roseateles sp. YR242]|uniref:SPOR domain-containing protein n=1 Tax=Roseateles sp. YR242 TaxID=1855305 RepID=UPI0008CDD4B1|nr:SPOR domain-containing protein [Roseateles sp. YR242]SEL29560.1 cell division protein FtsN [Roseateles sp. YR242]
MSKEKQRGGFAMGLIVGLLLGLGIALGVALYVTKAPVPFINKLPQRTAEQDAQEAERNRNWDPNAPLAGRAGAKAASGVVTAAPAVVPPAATPAPIPATPAPATAATQPVTPPAVDGRAANTAKVDASKPADKPVDKPADKPADGTRAGSGYFVQAGAFTRMEDAEQQRAKLAIQGFSAKVMEREQSGRTVYRVRLGPFDSRDEAEGQQKKLESAGIEANLVAVQR